MPDDVMPNDPGSREVRLRELQERFAGMSCEDILFDRIDHGEIARICAKFRDEMHPKCGCGLPMFRNPDPSVGAQWTCIPCLYRAVESLSVKASEATFHAQDLEDITRVRQNKAAADAKKISELTGTNGRLQLSMQFLRDAVVDREAKLEKDQHHFERYRRRIARLRSELAEKDAEISTLKERISRLEHP